MKKPKFSIIVPVYNTEKYLKRCLDSIKSQSFKDYEVIIVNDGSTDNSSDIISKYSYKVINQENQGLSMARNNGVKDAKLVAALLMIYLIPSKFNKFLTLTKTDSNSKFSGRTTV